MNKPQISETLPFPERQRLARLVEERGVIGAAQALSISRGVIERAVGGLPCRRGSIALLLMSLREIEVK